MSWSEYLGLLLERGKKEELAEILKNVIAADPYDLKMRFSLVMAHLEEERYDKAAFQLREIGRTARSLADEHRLRVDLAGILKTIREKVPNKPETAAVLKELEEMLRSQKNGS